MFPFFTALFNRLNWLNSDTIDADAEGDTKKSGLAGYFWNFKVSVELDNKTPVCSVTKSEFVSVLFALFSH
jgi:hypothetical protein